MDVEIKTLNKEELEDRLEELIKIEQQWTDAGETLWREENFRRDIKGKFELSKIALIDEEIGGYLIASQSENLVGKLNKIITLDEYRGNGIGTKLWNSLLDESRRKNLHKLEFKVLPQNQSAIRLYEKMGCIFDGMDMGTDKKERHNVHYIFQGSSRIPHSKPTIDNDDIAAAIDVISSGELSAGDNAAELISEVGGFTQKRYGVGTNSGANALFLALKALGISEESEVILPSYICGSVFHAIEMTRARPILTDIGEDDFNISYDSVRNRLTNKTKAIVVPHLFGKFASDTEKIKTLGIPVIEDCAQALGARYRGGAAGSFGDVSIFSFYPTKMVASSSGGLALTNNQEIYERMQNLLKNDNRPELGEAYSMNINDVSAAIALSQFSKLEKFVNRRIEIADSLNRYLFEDQAPITKEDYENIYFRYVIRDRDAQDVIANLNSRGIDVRRPVFRPLHDYLNLNSSQFPNTARAYSDALSLPIYPLLSNEEIKEIAGAYKNWRFEKS